MKMLKLRYLRVVLDDCLGYLEELRGGENGRFWGILVGMFPHCFPI